MQNKDIAANVGLDRRQVALWRSRFLEGGIEALSRDAPRSGCQASVMADMPSRIVQATPTGPSWLNMVERFFRDNTDKRICRSSFSSETVTSGMRTAASSSRWAASAGG